MRDIDERQKEALKLLIEKGADPNVQNQVGETPLHKSCQVDHEEAAIVSFFNWFI